MEKQIGNSRDGSLALEESKREREREGSLSRGARD